MKQKNINNVSYVRIEGVSMPYSPPKKTFWEYQFNVPNIGNGGQEYHTKYRLGIEIPPLSDFELEKNKDGFNVEPTVSLLIVQGLRRFNSRIKYLDFIGTPLYMMVSKSAKSRMLIAVNDVSDSIEEIRESFTNIYGTYNRDMVQYIGVSANE